MTFLIMLKSDLSRINLLNWCNFFKLRKVSKTFLWQEAMVKAEVSPVRPRFEPLHWILDGLSYVNYYIGKRKKKQPNGTIQKNILKKHYRYIFGCLLFYEYNKLNIFHYVLLYQACNGSFQICSLSNGCIIFVFYSWYLKIDFNHNCFGISSGPSQFIQLTQQIFSSKK